MRYAVIDLHKLKTAMPCGVELAVQDALRSSFVPGMSRLLNSAPDMLVALKEIKPLCDRAHKAYQFGAESYTYDALVALNSARVTVERVLHIVEVGGWRA